MPDTTIIRQGRNMQIKRFALILGICAAAVTAAGAQQPPPPPATNPTYKSLLDQGFDVKAVTFIPSEQATRIAGYTEPDTILMTLQKGPVVATCWVVFQDYRHQTIDDTLCDMRK